MNDKTKQEFYEVIKDKNKRKDLKEVKIEKELKKEKESK